jgi:hypothetical protein
VNGVRGILTRQENLAGWRSFASYPISFFLLTVLLIGERLLIYGIDIVQFYGFHPSERDPIFLPANTRCLDSSANPGNEGSMLDQLPFDVLLGKRPSCKLRLNKVFVI